jgi:hypothetical protein
VDAILKYTDLHVARTNGPGDDLAHKCSASIDILGTVEFGNKNGYVPTNSDMDSLEMIPIDDPRAVRASSALAQHINSVRSSTCPAKAPVADDSTKKIVYAKRGIVDDGRGQYRMEVLFGPEVFFTRIVHLPRVDQLVDPGTAKEDPHNFDGRFAVVAITPEPCGDAVADQLAVSLTGSDACPVPRIRVQDGCRHPHV